MTASTMADLLFPHVGLLNFHDESSLSKATLNFFLCAFINWEDYLERTRVISASNSAYLPVVLPGTSSRTRERTKVGSHSRSCVAPGSF